MEDVLEVDSIYQKINSRFTVSDIYLKCTSGEIVGVFGRNGAGKSILMKIIFGSHKAQNKFIRINDKVYKKPLFYYKDLIAYLPQHSFLPKRLKVQKVLKLYLNKKKLKEFSKDEIINQVIYNKVSELSNGELRYLEVKLILQTNAKFVMLDEPLTHLSPIIKEKIINIIKKKSKEKGIIISDHNYENINPLVAKMYLMKKGSIQKIKNRKELEFWNYLPNNI